MHSSLLPLHFAGIMGLGVPEMIVILAIFAFPVFVVSIIAAVFFFKHREQRLWHETARLALEKGQPLPPTNLEERVRLQKSARREDLAQHDVRGGMVLVAVGAGLWLMLGAISSQLRFVGAIPGFIGIALLLYAALNAAFSRKKSDSDRHPPQT